MLVTGITARTKQKYEVELEGQPAFVLYKGELSRYHIREGEELSEQTYRELTGEVLLKRAKLRAMHLLTRMDRTEAELRKKLEKDGYPFQLVDAALDYVKSYHYIDDERYVRQYLTVMAGRKSRKMIERELQQKGIEKTLFETVWEQEQEEIISETEQIRSLTEKKLKGNLISSEKELARMYGFLARKGYQSSDIRSVLREYTEELYR